MPLSLAELARAGNINMGDSIDDALGATYQDTEELRELLEVIKQAKFSHPGVRSLETKCARIEAKLALAEAAAARPADGLDGSGSDCESEDSFDTLSTLERFPPSAALRRASVAAAVLSSPNSPSDQQPQQLRRRSIVQVLIGSPGGRRGSVILEPGSPASIARRAGGAAHVAGTTTATAGRRGSLAVQTEMFNTALEAEEGAPRSEWALVILLALPLALGKLADELAMVGLVAMWGRMGTTALAAGNYSQSWQQLALAFMYGSQQALFTMVPQAAGAGNSKLVGNILTMSMLWTCIAIAGPVAVFYCFMGDLLPLPADASAVGYGYGYSSDSLGQLTVDCGHNLTNYTGAIESDDPELGLEQQCDLQCEITRYSRACAIWLLPYVGMLTAQTWLACLEIVSLVAINAAFWALTKVPLAWLLMFHFDMGLVGYAHTFTVATVGECVAMWYIVVCWKKQHINPHRWWHGLDLSRTGGVNPATLKRFLLLSVPMIASQLADSASATLFFSLMSGYSEQHVAAYGVLDALRWTGASISMGLYTASSIRVGTLLGEGKPDCARVAGLAGVSYNLVLGLVLCGLLIGGKEGVADFFVPNEEDLVVRTLVVEALPAMSVWVI
eukprot:COSAG06_NODE_3581_length_5158_cov_1.957304_3_plen_616_part_00